MGWRARSVRPQPHVHTTDEDVRREALECECRESEVAGYRHLEELGTQPRVYYLPPKNKKYPVPDMKFPGREKIKVKAKPMEMDMGNMQM